jgi:hypothetical protein
LGTDANRTEERKVSRYADLNIALSNEGWDCSRNLIKVGAWAYILKPVKDRLRSFFQAWVPADLRYCANDQACQLDFRCVFVFHISGLQ